MFLRKHKTRFCFPALPDFGLVIVCLAGVRLFSGSLEGAEQRPESPKKAAPVPVAAARQKSGEVNSGTVSETVITASKRLMLDAKGNEATFFGDVKVLDPRFSLNCNRLTAYLKRSGPEGKAGEAAEVAKNRTPGPSSGGGVEKAVAEGDVVIVQDKINDKGQIERSIGRGGKAVYDALTGDITLTGWPQVEQKQNTVVATEESTVIILNSKGTMEVLGHSKSVLRNVSQEEGR
jgi:lipopolysaccharide export system protein LptA